MTEPLESMKNGWLYLKIYVAKPPLIDEIICDILPSILADVCPKQWFYLRYGDDEGLHLRLRIQKDDWEESTLQSQIIEPINAFLRGDRTGSTMSYRPLIAMRDPDSYPSVTEPHLGFEIYRPEIHLYGGESGIEIAEGLFCFSSELAMKILLAERARLVDRKLLSISLMSSSAALLKHHDPTFWREYSYRWLGGRSSTADKARETFKIKFRDLRTKNLSIFGDSHGESKDFAQLWNENLEMAFNRYRALSSYKGEFQIVHLYIMFAHLMNNRLGISVLEEAYLATLLELTVADAMLQSRECGK